MKIDMMKMKEEVGISGADLLTRLDGQKFYQKLVERINGSTDRLVVELDFRGIKTLDLSFCDECLATLIHKDLLENNFGDCVLIIKDLDSVSAIENFNAALDYYRKICCFVFNETPSAEYIRDNVKGKLRDEKLHDRIGRVNSQYSYILLGSLEQNLMQTLKHIIENHEVTARTIADSFDLNINTASTRLLKLYQKHLIHRKEEVSSEGRQYIYTSPF